jgi:hypothetical protein
VIPDYLKNVVRILDHGLKTNSYKFALLRSLADIARQTEDQQPLAYELLAEKFLSYYWPLTVIFRVRQATDPTRDPIVMKFIRWEVNELGLSANHSLEKYQNAFPERYQNLVNRCCEIRGCFDHVVPRFHPVHGHGVEPRLYTYTRNQLNVAPDVMHFLREYSGVIEKLAIGSWVRFTEQYTNAPRLYERRNSPQERLK